MLIALLVVLGVDLVVVAVLVFGVFLHHRWLKAQPGEFAGAIRVSSGDAAGLRSTWSRGSGRWVRDVVVWNGAPLRLRCSVRGIDEVAVERIAADGEVKRLGPHPAVVQLVMGGAVVEVAAPAVDHARLVGQP